MNAISTFVILSLLMFSSICRSQPSDPKPLAVAEVTAKDGSKHSLQIRNPQSYGKTAPLNNQGLGESIASLKEGFGIFSFDFNLTITLNKDAQEGFLAFSPDWFTIKANKVDGPKCQIVGFQQVGGVVPFILTEAHVAKSKEGATKLVIEYTPANQAFTLQGFALEHANKVEVAGTLFFVAPIASTTASTVYLTSAAQLLKFPATKEPK